MFWQIFLFEIGYRLRRPAFYVYFSFVFLFTLFGFANGAVPVVEKEFINAPAVLAIYMSTATVFMMLVSSAIMGVPLYRDLEHNTKEYYFSYPITRAGYFWGRFSGSFVFVVLIGAALIPGIYFGCQLGQVLGWIPASRFEAHRFLYYWQPFVTLVIPSLFFTAALFFGLVAIFRNVKVIYSSGIFLFLGYLIGNFFLKNIHDPRVIFLADPFLVNGPRFQTDGWSIDQLNHDLIPMSGLALANRILWTGVGVLVLLLTYRRFSFERFFGGQSLRKGRRVRGEAAAVATRAGIRAVFRQVRIKLDGSYYRKILFSLTRIEILNIVRDNYFWIILSGGLMFLSFVFWHGPSPYGVSDYPRAVFFMDAFTNFFTFFIFFLIIFYTGETVHRERVTRFASINDVLPPPTWVLNGAKLASLFCLAVFLSAVPVFVGVGVQLCRGYYQFNFPVYFTAYFFMTLPRLLEMVLFCYAIHIVVPNKFAGHGIGITIWAAMAMAANFNYFNYNLLLFGFTPFAAINDMDGIGHMQGPISWFNAYWLLAGVMLVLLGSLFYQRGVGRSFRENWKLARLRFHGRARAGIVACLFLFAVLGGYVYYNVSYLHEYLTSSEQDRRSALQEKALKRYAGLPLPRITRMQMEVELYPQEQRELTKARITVMNKGVRPIDSLLIDGEDLTEYSVLYNGQAIAYSTPLYFARGKFNLFRPKEEPSDFRVYRLPAPLRPGDSAVFEVSSETAQHGVQNDLYGRTQLYNGIFFTGGLPNLGYDEGEELSNNDKRREQGLPIKIPKDILPEDSIGRRSLQSQVLADLVSLDITVGTSDDQTAVAPGVLEKEWHAGGRHYFHYVQDRPMVYMPFGIASARYAVRRDTVMLSGKVVDVEIYYHPAHSVNVDRFMGVCKDGLRVYSEAFGPYPFGQLRLVESAGYGPYKAVFINTIVYSERYGWNADMRDPGAMDYLYYNGAEQVAHQWWGQQVAANHTEGAGIVTDGLSKYAALLLMQGKHGDRGLKRALQFEGFDYSWGRWRNFFKENDLLHANRGYLASAKAGVVLTGLRELIGADSLHAALREFFRGWAFRNGGEYAGGGDLYRVLQKHVPDSLQYYLRDSWERTCLYDNKVQDLQVTPLDGNRYKVRLTVDVKKVYVDTAGNDVEVPAMKDCIEIGVYAGAGGENVKGRSFGASGEDRVLYLGRRWLTAGRHVIELVVDGKPDRAGIDPRGLLIDRMPEDNMRNVQ